MTEKLDAFITWLLDEHEADYDENDEEHLALRLAFYAGWDYHG